MDSSDNSLDTDAEVKRTAILVLGMHRSGTSMLTRILNLHGVALPSNLEPANEFNQKGYWESRDIMAVHDRLLAQANSSWKDCGQFPPSWLESGQGEPYRKELVAILQREFQDAPLFLVKDPRVCRLMPLWEQVLEDLKARAVIVIPFRNPAEVAQSLNRRDELHQQRSLAIWLRHVLDAERASRGLPRTFISFQSLLEDWASSLDRLQTELNLALPLPSDSVYSEVESEVSGNLKHYTISQARIGRSRLSSLVTRAYQALQQMELGETKDSKQIFDAIAKEFEPIAETLGPILVNEDAKLDDSRAQTSKANDRIAQLTADREAEKQANNALVQEREALFQERDAFISQIEKLQTDYRVLEQEQDDLERDYAGLKQEQSSVVKQYQQALEDKSELEARLDAVYSSTSWRIALPVRVIKRGLSGFLRIVRRSVAVSVRTLWRIIPVGMSSKASFKSAVFLRLPRVFGKTAAYQAWLELPENKQVLKHEKKNDLKFIADEPVFVARRQAGDLIEPKAKLIAFYLPQFHAIPENDAWWGKGFTEWTNVKPAQPQFEGHYQPREPEALGYYNLLDKTTQQKQVELAKQYGIHGFCFYFYWFHGERLLEDPVRQFLEDRDLDLPFCLCWANENWSRRWDGLDSEILIAQDHSTDDDIAFISHISAYMRDDRYIRINGKLLLLVYRPALLPRAKTTARVWRKWCRDNGIGEIFLAYTQSFEKADPADYGFDAAIEFPPNNISPVDLADKVPGVQEDFTGKIYDGSTFVQRSRYYDTPVYKLFRAVCPSWDNTARRKNRGTIFANMTVANYAEWLRNAINDTCSRFKQADERLVFVNAWNEWAEGAYLEPDLGNGYAYLQATRNAIASSGDTQHRNVALLVTHDCHPHGAQLLLLESAKCLKSIGFDLYLIALDTGKLESDFMGLGKFICVSEETDASLDSFISRAIDDGVTTVITSTVVSGSIVPKLKESGLRLVSLIHELPGVIKDMAQEENAGLIAEYANKVVFPAELVRSGFAGIVDIANEKVEIRHQGLLRQNPYKSNPQRARELVIERHDLAQNTKIVLAMAYGDRRKGIDLFIDIALKTASKIPDVAFVWVGHLDETLEQELNEQIAANPLAKSVVFTGYVKEPLEYYAAADVYALTSREDPFPNVVLEALEVFLPVAAFAGVTGASQLISGHGGKLVDAFDTDAFSEAVIEFVSRQGRDKVSLAMAERSLPRYVLDLLSFSGRHPRVSVVLPNFEYEQHIIDRLDSIVKQTYPIYELIVLDDASGDRSPGLIQSFLDESAIDSIYIANEENSGSVFKQWTKGLEHCSGDLVWIAEADDLSSETFLAELVAEFLNKDIVMAYCQSKQIDDSGAVLAENYLDYTRDISDKWKADYSNAGIDEIREAMCVKNTIPNASAVLFNRDSLEQAIDQLGEKLFNYRVAGDWLIYLELLQLGGIAFKHQPLNLHRRHETSVTTSSAGLGHIEEVRDAQLRAQEIAQADEATKDQADRYISQLHEYFDVA